MIAFPDEALGLGLWDPHASGRPNLENFSDFLDLPLDSVKFQKYGFPAMMAHRV